MFVLFFVSLFIWMIAIKKACSTIFTYVWDVTITTQACTYALYCLSNCDNYIVIEIKSKESNKIKKPLVLILNAIIDKYDEMDEHSNQVVN